MGLPSLYTALFLSFVMSSRFVHMHTQCSVWAEAGCMQRMGCQGCRCGCFWIYSVQQEPSKLQQGYTNIQSVHVHTHQLPWGRWSPPPALRVPGCVCHSCKSTHHPCTAKVRQCTNVSHLLGPRAMLSCRNHLRVPAQATLNSNRQHYVQSSRPKRHHHLQQTPNRSPGGVCKPTVFVRGL